MGCAITFFSLFVSTVIHILFPPIYISISISVALSMSTSLILITVSISQVLFNFLSLSLSFFVIVILFLSFCPLIQGYLRSGDIAEFDADNHPKVQCVTTVFDLLFLS